MQYLFLSYANLTREEVADLPAEEQQQLWADWGAINRTPGVTPGTGMDAPPTATTVRVQGGGTLTTDGPFPDVKGRRSSS